MKPSASPVKPHARRLAVIPEPALLPARSLALDVSVQSIAIILLKRRWLIISLTLLCFVIFGGIEYTPQKWYTASASFNPKARATSSVASSLLARFGLGGSSSAADPYLVELVKSRSVLGGVVESKFSFRTDTSVISGTLAEIYGIRNRPRDITRSLAIGNLGYKVKSVPQGPYLIKVSVETPYAELSPLVATRIIEELNRVNMENRRAAASKDREFIEAQLVEAGMRLRHAEDELQLFEERNRSFLTSSFLAFQRDRLRRQLTMRQDLYTSLAKTLDKARIAEVQQNPVLSIVERPEVPLAADRPKWIEKAVLGAFFGFFLGITLSFFHSYFVDEAHPFSAGANEYKKLRRALQDDVGRFFRRVGAVVVRAPRTR